MLGISIFGYLGLQLFLGGVMPIPTWKGAVVFYVALAGAITTVCLAIYGWPQPQDWASTWLPALAGPAILVIAYIVIARLGHWRIDRQIERLGQ